MFDWSSRLYLDDKVKKNFSKYKKIVEQNKMVKHCYLLTLPFNDKNCMDIYSSRELWFQYYRKRQMTIIGVAATKDSAMDLVARIVTDVYEVYQDVGAQQVHEYFLET